MLPEMRGPLVVCTVLERDAERAARGLREAPAGCALVELRADYLRAEQIAGLVGRADRPLIVTIRRTGDGGGFDGSEQQRVRALRVALDAGARFVDVEWDAAAAGLAAEAPFRGRVILSHHGVACRFEELSSLLGRMAARREAPLKIVVSAEAVDQLQSLPRLLDSARGAGVTLAAFAMGRAGAISRLLAPSWGSWATYGATARGLEAAPGQFPASEMFELFDVLGIGDQTARFALIGSRVAASPSPAMHAAGYRALGLDARYFPVELDALEPFVRLLDGAGSIGFDAFAVTMPFKQAVAARCEAGDELSAACGAVNTVVVADRTWTGYNTDGPGALARIRRRLDPAGARAAVLGAGGTARAIAASLVRAGAQVTLFNRSEARAVEAAAAVGARAAALDRLPAFGWDLLIQATPQGSDGERFFDPQLLVGRLVLDAVYRREPTALVRDARARGLEVIDGLELLAAQAVLQFRLMTGREVDHAVLHAAAASWLAGPGRAA